MTLISLELGVTLKFIYENVAQDTQQIFRRNYFIYTCLYMYLYMYKYANLDLASTKSSHSPNWRVQNLFGEYDIKVTP